MKNSIRFSLLFIVAGMISACSSTRLTSSWLKEGYTAQKYNKILVFAVTSKVSNRAIVETAMADELKKAGVNAVSSIYIFPLSQNVTPEQLKAMPKEELVQKLKDNGVDGLLILSLLDKKEEQVYVQGATYTQPTTVYHPGYYNHYYPYYNNYYNYYSTVYTTVTTPGYYENQTSLFLESNFYNVNNDEGLVWSAQSTAVDPSSVGQGAADWAVEVVSGMKISKVFQH